MRRTWMMVMILAATTAVQLQAAPDEPKAGAHAAQLPGLAQQWLARAESGDLVPAWNAEEQPTGIPQSYQVSPPFIKESGRQCRANYEKNRRSLLLCLDVFSVFPRNDLPRAQLRLPTNITQTRAERPPVVNIQVR